MSERIQLEPGIHYGVPFEEYVKIEAINNSVLKIIAQQTPMHAHYYQQHGFDSACLDFGRIHHTMLLEPGEFDKIYAIGPNVRRNANQWKEFEANTLREGREPIKREQYDEAKAFVTAVRKQKVAKFVSEGKSEVTLIWRDTEPVDVPIYNPKGEWMGEKHFEPTGLMQKARADYVREQDDIISDIKGVMDASPTDRGFFRAAANFRYHQQAAMTSHGWEMLTGRTPAFCFVVIEKCPAKADCTFWPFPSAAYEAQPIPLAEGLMAYRNALQTYAECLACDDWPGYMTNEVLRLELPAWALGAA